MNWLSELFLKRQSLWLSFAIITALLACYGVSRLEFDPAAEKLLLSDDEETAIFLKARESFGSDDQLVIALVRSDQILSPVGLEFLREICSEVKRIQNVETVTSLLDVVHFESGITPKKLCPLPGAAPEDFSKARQLAKKLPLVHEQILSAKGSHALIFIHADPKLDSLVAIRPIIDELDSLFAKLNEEQSAKGLKNSVAQTGLPRIRTEIEHVIKTNQILFLGVATLLATIVAWFLFRKIATTILVAMAPILAVLFSMGSMGLVGIQLNLLNIIMPTLILVIAFTDSVHLIIHYAVDRAKGHNKAEAAAGSIRQLGLACLLTSLTTAIGFASLYRARLEVIQDFGIACALGCGIGLLVVLMFVPLLATSPLGTRPSVPWQGQSKIWKKLLQPQIRAPKLWSLCGVIFTATLLWGSFHLQPDHRLKFLFPTDSVAFKIAEETEREFGGYLLSRLILKWPEGEGPSSETSIQVLQETQSVLENYKVFEKTLSPLSVYRSMPNNLDLSQTDSSTYKMIPPKLLRNFINLERRECVVQIRVPDLGGAELLPSVTACRAQLRQLESKYAGYKLTLTGTPVLTSLHIHQMITDLASSLILASVVIFVVIALSFRSLRWGLISLIPNAFPLVATASFMVLMGIPLQLGTVIIFSMSLGIAVDDTIHVLTRYRQELLRGLHPHQAMQNTMESVGRALLTTTIVLFVGFGSVTMSSIPVNQNFGILASFSMVMALIGDLLILPAMLVAFGTPRKLKRDRIDLDLNNGEKD